MPQRENAEQRRTGRSAESEEETPQATETAPSELDSDVDAILADAEAVRKAVPAK